MIDVTPTIITDDDGHPVAVQIDYDAWKQIEAELAGQDRFAHDPPAEEAPEADASDPEAPSDVDTSPDESRSLRELAEAARPYWKGGDGLEYQRRIRSEWTRSWDPEYSEENESSDDD